MRQGRVAVRTVDTSQQRLISSFLLNIIRNWLCLALLQRPGRAANDAAQELDLRRDVDIPVFKFLT